MDKGTGSQLLSGIDSLYLLEGEFIGKQVNLIFYGGVGTANTYLFKTLSQNGKIVKFCTVAQLVNELMAN